MKPDEKTTQPALLLTTAEFASRIGVSYCTARNMMRDGRVSFCKVGRRNQVPATEVDRLIGETLRPRREAEAVNG